MFHMGLSFLHEPLCRVPRSGSALPGDSLEPAWAAHVLHAKGDKLFRRPHPDMKEAPAAAAAGLCTFSGCRGTGHGDLLKETIEAKASAPFDSDQPFTES